MNNTTSKPFVTRAVAERFARIIAVAVLAHRRGDPDAGAKAHRALNALRALQALKAHPPASAERQRQLESRSTTNV